MEAVKKSIYLDGDLDEPLRLAAKADGRSVTSQINVYVREGLGLRQRPTLRVVGLDKTFKGPDPKIKPSKKRT